MEPLTPERINRAIAWYRQNKANIKAALPLRTKGRLFRAGWPEALERSIILWESGSSPVNLAVIYIYWPIVLVARTLKVQAEPCNQPPD